MDQFSSIPIRAAQALKIDASGVGAAAKSGEFATGQLFPLSLRQQATPGKAARPLLPGLDPNPYYQLAPPTGTSYFSSPTLARSTLSAPYPQFGGITIMTRTPPLLV
jgi:hypothetical protein